MVLPVGAALTRWHDRIAARRIDLGRTSARNHSNVSVSTNDRDCMDFRRENWKHGLIVLQKNDALFFDPLRNLESFFNLHHTILRGIINDPRHKFRIQDSAGVVINFGQRNLTGLHSFLKPRPEKICHRLLLVKPGCRCLFGTMGSAPIGNHKAFKSPILLEHITQRV